LNLFSVNSVIKEVISASTYLNTSEITSQVTIFYKKVLDKYKVIV